MLDLKINCAECGAENSVNEALSAELRKKFFAEFQHEFKQHHHEQSQANDQRAIELNAQEAALIKRGDEVDAEVSRRVAEQRSRDKQEIETRANELAHQRTQSHKTEIEALQKQIEADRANGIEVERLKRQVAANEGERELEIERLRTHHLEKAREEVDRVRREANESWQKKLDEKDLQHKQALKAVKNSESILDQGSQQIQGEALETRLEDYLESKYPLDEIRPVPKGVSGADCLLLVNGKSTAPHGSILFEVKNTKSWSKGWVPKLRRDAQAAKADFSILITKTLPSECGDNDFCEIDGVVICSFDSATIIIDVYRKMASFVYQQSLKNNSSGSEKDQLWEYVHSQMFFKRVQLSVDMFKNLELELRQHQNYVNRSFAKASRIIEQINSDIMATLGDFEAILESRSFIDHQLQLEQKDLH